MSLKVECDRVSELYSTDQVVTANYLVTDPEGLFAAADVDSSPTREVVEGLEERFDRFEVSREEDYFRVRNRGALESLAENRMRYECRENSDLIHLAAFVMKVLAENQVFGDGNKRTAYLAGAVFLVKYQVEVLGKKNAVIPELDEELVEILQALAVGEEGLQRLEKYMKTVERDIERL
jgi:prophage maintenance system killer protein